MSPLLLMLFAALGPMMAVCDIFDGDENEDEEDDGIAIGDANHPYAGGAAQGNPLLGMPVDGNYQSGTSGDDTLLGEAQDDWFVGLDGADSLSGAEGDDTLIGGLNSQDQQDDDAQDTLDGGDGDDTLLLGDGDIGLGGSGADSFVTMGDASGNVTVGDYQTGIDALMVETDDEDASVLSQFISGGVLKVSLSTGMTITLPGVENPLHDNELIFVMPNSLYDGL